MSNFNGKFFLNLTLLGTCCLALPHFPLFAGCCGDGSRVANDEGSSGQNQRTANAALPRSYDNPGPAPSPRTTRTGSGRRDEQNATPPLPLPYADVDGAQATGGDSLLISGTGGNGADIGSGANALPLPYPDGGSAETVDRETSSTSLHTHFDGLEAGYGQENGQLDPNHPVLQSRASDSLSKSNESASEGGEIDDSQESAASYSEGKSKAIVAIKRSKSSVHSLDRVDSDQPGLLEATIFFNNLSQTVRVPLKSSFERLDEEERGILIDTSKVLLGNYYGDKDNFEAQQLLIIQRIIKNVKYHGNLKKLYKSVTRRNKSLSDKHKLQLAAALVQLSPKHYKVFRKEFKQNHKKFKKSTKVDAEEFVAITISNVKKYFNTCRHRFEDTFVHAKKKRQESWND